MNRRTLLGRLAAGLAFVGLAPSVAVAEASETKALAVTTGGLSVTGGAVFSGSPALDTFVAMDGRVYEQGGDGRPPGTLLSSGPTVELDIRSAWGRYFKYDMLAMDQRTGRRLAWRRTADSPVEYADDITPGERQWVGWKIGAGPLTFEAMQQDCAARGCELTMRYAPRTDEYRVEHRSVPGSAGSVVMYIDGDFRFTRAVDDLRRGLHNG